MGGTLSARYRKIVLELCVPKEKDIPFHVLMIIFPTHKKTLGKEELLTSSCCLNRMYLKHGWFESLYEWLWFESSYKDGMMCFYLGVWSQHCILLIDIWNENKMLWFLTCLFIRIPGLVNIVSTKNPEAGALSELSVGKAPFPYWGDALQVFYSIGFMFPSM